MALSRAYLGAHWLSDALAGVLLGASCALLAAFAVGELQGRRTAHRAARSAHPPVPAAPAGGPAMSSPPVPAGPPAGRLLPSSRYRHPGDVIRLISAGLLLAVLARRLGGRVPVAARPGRTRTRRSRPEAGRVITGLVQVACLAAAVVVVAATLRRRRFRLLAGLAAGAAAAGCSRWDRHLRSVGWRPTRRR